MTEPTTLADLVVGQEAVVTQVAADGHLAQQLMQMGLVEGTPVKLVRLAPMGDPMEIAVRGFRLSLRRTDANAVRVSLTTPAST